ncbi:MAG: hypothetical protein HC841_04565 [Verrucomicrobiae bacterium]|nr:hypothetical protein [Verrucomicrobiae bacterium]
MITPRDEDYQQTKLLKLSGAPLKSPFKELADWVGKRYGVQVLNVFYDTIQPDNRPRLSVILETQEDAQKFRKGALGNFNNADQKEVQEHFDRILQEQGNLNFDAQRLFVIFVAFERVAMEEANESVTDEEVAQLKSKLANNDLWEISRCFDSVTFFFFTDVQVKKYEAAGLRRVYAEEYSRLVHRHDVFGYLKKRGVSAHFDSKENFDKNFESNWYYYYK